MGTNGHVLLQSFFYPKRIAVLGASRTPGKIGYAIIKNLLTGGYCGEVVPINPSAKEILGVKCYPDLLHAASGIDLGIIVLPASAVIPSLKELAHVGVKGAVVISGGFKEVGGDGERLQGELVDVCRASGIRVMGPNCIGIISTDSQMNGAFVDEMPKAGSVSVIAQSGAICSSILRWALGRGFGLSKVLSIGNKADLNESDFLNLLADDEKTRVIACYLESIENGDAFLEACKKTTMKKPVIVLKAGITAAGNRAASSHTGSLAGSEAVYCAALQKAGAIHAANFQELMDFAVAFSNQPLPKGKMVAIVTNAGGCGVLAADSAEKAALVVPKFSEALEKKIRLNVPAIAAVSNPVDMTGDADLERYANVLKTVLDDPSVDAAIVGMAPQAIVPPEAVAQGIQMSVHPQKPILSVFMGGEKVIADCQPLRESGIPAYPSPERAVRALQAMFEYSLRSHVEAECERLAIETRIIRRVLSLKPKGGYLGEGLAKEVLNACGLTVPNGELVKTHEAARQAASKLRPPFVMKIQSEMIVHKSDCGGVELGIDSPEEATEAFERIVSRARKAVPSALIDGVRIEEMAAAGLELIIGMKRDKVFGPLLMFGLGGVFVEIMKDVSFALAPLSEVEAVEMIQSTRGYGLLKGARGKLPVDLRSISKLIRVVGQLSIDFPRITELDINPCIIPSRGANGWGEPIIADARILLGSE